MFAQVRRAFTQRLEHSLSLLDAKGVQQREGPWWTLKCPMPGCQDQGGSASVHTDTGYLKCFQCGTAAELFEWTAKVLDTLPGWGACANLARQLGVPLPEKRKVRPKILDEEELQRLEMTLWSNPDEYYVHELAARGLTCGDLEPYRLGRNEHGLVFPSFDPAGRLLPRAHLWRGPKSEPRWVWWPKVSKEGHGTPQSLWPGWIPPESDQDVWLMEGEWDTLIARTKFSLSAYTWTGGAGAPLIASRLPSWFSKRKVRIVYDLDVYAGVQEPGNRNQANLLNRIVPMLVNRQCEVLVCWVPLDRATHPKGDFRDWWTLGGRDLAQLHQKAWKEAVEERTRVYELRRIDDLAEAAGRAVEFTCSVAGLELVPKMVYPVLHVKCPIGAFKACETCRLAAEHPDGAIDMREYPGLRARFAAYSGDLHDAVKRWLHPGRDCPGFEITEMEEQKPGESRWSFIAAPPVPEDGVQVELRVFSPVQPLQAKDYRVRGWVTPALTDSEVLVEADQVMPSERLPMDLLPFVQELKRITPWNSDRADEVLLYLEQRDAELAQHVTGIHGMPWCRALELVAHSALQIPTRGDKAERGWLDVCFVGFTRTGKTTTARRMLELYGLGRYVSAQSAVSKAGITVTIEKGGRGGWKARPGLFPRMDGQMLVLDELHTLVDQHNKQNVLMQELQSARDIGTLETIKAVSLRYSARVRLVCMANPPQRLGFSHYAFPCEVVKDLYCTDEAIGRMDFLICGVQPANMPSPPMPQRWKQSFVRALVHRAWDLKPADVSFDVGVEEKAADVVAGWSQRYCQDLPLFTVAEKQRSLLRIATAVSNLRFGHLDDPRKCFVRQADVAVAQVFLEQSWADCAYDAWSANKTRRTPPQPLVIEHLLWFPIDASAAIVKLDGLGRECGRNMLAEMLGLGANSKKTVEQWISGMLGAQGLQVSRPGLYVLTEHARGVLEGMHRLIDSQNGSWAERKEKISAWVDKSIPGMMEPEAL